jgi:flagellar protein FlbT
MSTLILELRQGDVMVVNGAPIRFRTKARVELTAKARFLFGKQIMRPEQVSTPARRIYFALQAAYIGTEEERVRGLAAARTFVAAFSEATTSSLARDILARALAAAEQDDCYKALKLIRRVMSHEDAVLQGTTDSAALTEGPPLPALDALTEPQVQELPTWVPSPETTLRLPTATPLEPLVLGRAAASRSS